MFFAAKNGNVEIVHMLLKGGSTKDMRDMVRKKWYTNFNNIDNNDDIPDLEYVPMFMGKPSRANYSASLSAEYVWIRKLTHTRLIGV